MLQLAQTVLALYGLLLIAGGIMGKFKSDSSVSLYAGGISGLVALYAYWTGRTDPATGLLIGLMLSLLLTGISLSRFIRTRKLMPAGLLLIASILTAALVSYSRNQLAGTVSV
jgi:uncharacterized membrane protein (UPF0136 family)